MFWSIWYGTPHIHLYTWSTSIEIPINLIRCQAVPCHSLYSTTPHVVSILVVFTRLLPNSTIIELIIIITVICAPYGWENELYKDSRATMITAFHLRRFARLTRTFAFEAKSHYIIWVMRKGDLRVCVVCSNTLLFAFTLCQCVLKSAWLYVYSKTSIPNKYCAHSHCVCYCCWWYQN